MPVRPVVSFGELKRNAVTKRIGPLSIPVIRAQSALRKRAYRTQASSRGLIRPTLYIPVITLSPLSRVKSRSCVTSATHPLDIAVAA